MKVLVTGNLGYIGSVLTPTLVNKGYQVVGYDVGFYDGFNALPPEFSRIKQIRRDIRDIKPDDVTNIDAIIHLAALSNDPLGELNPQLTRQINYESTVNLARMAKEAGVRRFVFVASQSMYGVSDNTHELEEDNSEKNPVTEYAKTKWEAEQVIRELNGDNFTTVSFRPSTVFGVSPRLRLDIVFNRMVACAYANREIEIRNDGTPWRPVVHVRDVSQVLVAGIEAPDSLIAGESFNVGLPNGNFTLNDLAKAASEVVPGSKIVYTGEENDPRTYRVSFNKILTRLGDHYKPEWDLIKGGEELVRFFEEINFSREQLDGRLTNRLAQLRHLKEIGQLDPELRMVSVGQERK